MENIVIYTDGSHFKNGGSGRLGIGGLILINDKLTDTFSEEIDKSYLEKNYGTSDCSNPTMEMLAVLFALREFKSYIKGKRVTFKMDYNGVVYWLTGKWQTKMSYIRKIKEEILDEIKSNGVIANYVWVKGHQSIMSQDAYWNNEVDKLAKGQI